VYQPRPQLTTYIMAHLSGGLMDSHAPYHQMMARLAPSAHLDQGWSQSRSHPRRRLRPHLYCFIVCQIPCSASTHLPLSREMGGGLAPSARLHRCHHLPRHLHNFNRLVVRDLTFAFTINLPGLSPCDPTSCSLPLESIPFCKSDWVGLLSAPSPYCSS
jgi:hypothetical protein